ncbi:unnamed protein product, partial [Polarella glacialis]
DYTAEKGATQGSTTTATTATTTTATATATGSGDQLTLTLRADKPGRKRGGCFTDLSSWAALWQQLLLRGWRLAKGWRKNDSYWLPPGVKRESPWKNRVHYFDSKLQVVRHLRDHWQVVVQVAAEEDPGAEA